MDVDYRKIVEWHGPKKCLALPKRGWSAGTADRQIERELAEMGVPDCMIETDHQPGRDYTISGRPRSGISPETSRVQLWFHYRGEPVCLPSWGYADWRDNLKAIAMTLERQRLIRDYGVVTVKHQVQAFQALPPGSGQLGHPQTAEDAARKILSMAVEPIVPESVRRIIEDGAYLRGIYRRAAELHHPDKVGDHGKFNELGEAKGVVEAHRRVISGA